MDIDLCADFNCLIHIRAEHLPGDEEKTKKVFFCSLHLLHVWLIGNFWLAPTEERTGCWRFGNNVSKWRPHVCNYPFNVWQYFDEDASFSQMTQTFSVFQSLISSILCARSKWFTIVHGLCLLRRIRYIEAKPRIRATASTWKYRILQVKSHTTEQNVPEMESRKKLLTFDLWTMGYIQSISIFVSCGRIEYSNT